MSDEELRRAEEIPEDVETESEAGIALEQQHARSLEPAAGIRELEHARAIQRGEEFIEEHDPSGCSLCPGCSTRIAITEAAIVGLVRRVAERDEMIAELAGALAAAKPLFESLVPAEGEDPPSLLKVLAKLARGGR